MRKYFWLSLTCAALLASCGGGSSDGEDVGPAPGVQQYPGGVWEGTVGTGAAQRQVVGYIDPGPLGTGGEFYMAREAPGAAGFDAFYGRLNVNVTAVLATGVTYYSVQDGKFATGLTLRGTASNSGKIGRTDGISGIGELLLINVDGQAPFLSRPASNGPDTVYPEQGQAGIRIRIAN